ncbi:MAG: dephospho-CoA kinase [Hyphomicrobiales bacterium]|nr:MAG: dephospho-CoA kinase [Hyphomicrobiales bacterium]
MIILGLTGSIGMGKSTTAKMFAAAGVPVHDADATVHALYRGAAVAPVEARFPGTTVDGAIDRKKLGAAVIGKPDEMKALEAIVHPLVREAEIAFLRKNFEAHRQIVALDIPLLFETGGDTRVDAAIVVTADEAVQRERVLARPGMTADMLAALIAKQMPDAEKRRRAHFLVDSGFGYEPAERQVRGILRAAAAMAGKTALQRLRPRART